MSRSLQFETLEGRELKTTLGGDVDGIHETSIVETRTLSESVVIGTLDSGSSLNTLGDVVVTTPRMYIL